MSQANQTKEDNFQEEQHPPRTVAEKVTFGIASLILASIVGLVLYLWFSKQYQNPPEISVSEAASVRESKGQFYVPFEVTNAGGETAESVQIIAELKVNGEVEESGEQQIDFLSGGETEEGAFVFSQDPRSGELTLRVASYKLP